MPTVTGKVRHPSWKKKARSKRKISVFTPKAPAKILSNIKTDYKSAVRAMDEYTKEELRAKRKAKEERKAKAEKSRIARNHLEGPSDMIAAFGEASDKARPLPEQLKALKRQKMRIQFKIDRILNYKGVRKSEFGPMRTTALADALKDAENVSTESKLAIVKEASKAPKEGNEALVSYESALTADDKARLEALRFYIQRVDFNIWKLTEQMKNPQFNRNAVKRERHFHADKGKQVTLPIGNRERLDKAKPSSNNWRKEMNAKEVARILYVDNGPENVNAFNLALASFNRMPDKEKRIVQEYKLKLNDRLVNRG